MKNMKVFYIALLKDSTNPKTPYLIQFDNAQPLFFEIPFDNVNFYDEAKILKQEIIRVFIKDLGKVSLQLVKGKVVETI